MERRAFKQALFAMRDEEAALDAVQDAMLRLSEKYGDRPKEELPMLFQRILQNAIRDWMRRSKVRATWTTLLSAFTSEDAETDLLETLEVEDPSRLGESPQKRLEREQIIGIIEAEIQKLPPRQREAFVMRYWEDMDTEETAAVMGCSEGSVKTHCHRAVHTLAAALKLKGIAP